MSQKLTLKFNRNNFIDFVQKINDLTNIEDIIKIKIDSQEIFMYSLLSNDNAVLSLKNWTLKTSDYFTDFKIESSYEFIILSASKFVKNLKFFNTDSDIKFIINYKEHPKDSNINQIRTSQITNGKLKITWIGGEDHKIKDITKHQLDNLLNIKMRKWSFTIKSDDFIDIKKLSQINNEVRFINVNVKEGQVIVNERSKWDLIIDHIDYKDTQITFDKKHLGYINIDHDNGVIFSVFENFILIKGDNWNLMLSFENDFED